MIAAIEEEQAYTNHFCGFRFAALVIEHGASCVAPKNSTAELLARPQVIIVAIIIASLLKISLRLWVWFSGRAFASLSKVLSLMPRGTINK